MFIDRAKIYVKGGDGGNGVVAFRREKFVPRGGPSGGDGGKGGDIILKTDPNLSTLMDFRYRRHYKAKRGEHGQGSNKIGRSAENMIIYVPKGTVVKDGETGKILVDLVYENQSFVVAKGGRGGRGNARFVSSVHRVPDFAEKGEPGQERWIVLELKLLADVGLIGMPNAGKSTLLSQVTRAKPKIAEYPFTTLSPNLGVVDLELEHGKSFVIADIPGLIEGAHEGQGLGHEFLRHVERTKVLVHVIDMTGFEGDPLDNFKAINEELEKYSPDLVKKPQIVAANKMDISEALKNFEDYKALFEKINIPIFPISAVTGQGVGELINYISKTLDKLPKSEEPLVFKAETHHITKEEPFYIQKEGESFKVRGKTIERLVAMTDLNNESAVKRLQRTFKHIGLDDALKEKGIKPGDVVFIGDTEFFHVE